MMLPIGLGMAAYGVIYFLFHDVIVHRRLRLPRLPHSVYLRRIIKAHLVHHRTHQRDGAESFGFLYTPNGFGERRR
jgi:beta-carotene 3-hydroxylase